MQIKVLDHGYVRFVEAWGKGDAGLFAEFDEVTRQESHDYECGIVEAARQSTQGSFRGWDKDTKLLKYLHDHKHATPFEFAGMVIEVQAPIFVFREWHRHRTQSYNEMSARYSPLPDLYYVPTLERLMMNSGSNKQAQGIGVPLEDRSAEEFRGALIEGYERCQTTYEAALASGIQKELARCIMPVGHYTRMRASANLRNWLAFLTLRMDPAAQWEIRQFANAVGELVSAHFPRTWSLFEASRS